MMNEVKYADLCDKLSEMSISQLEALAEQAKDAIIGRRDRFEYLCTNLYTYLETLQKEFPNANVYLCEHGEPDVNLMSYIIPQYGVEVCEIGD